MGGGVRNYKAEWEAGEAFRRVGVACIIGEALGNSLTDVNHIARDLIVASHLSRYNPRCHLVLLLTFLP
jgi:hypothetical protein